MGAPEVSNTDRRRTPENLDRELTMLAAARALIAHDVEALIVLTADLDDAAAERLLSAAQTAVERRTGEQLVAMVAPTADHFEPCEWAEARRRADRVFAARQAELQRRVYGDGQ
jgi:hypothetical protein